jgi:hypothetical protein
MRLGEGRTHEQLHAASSKDTLPAALLTATKFSSDSVPAAVLTPSYVLWRPCMVEIAQLLK